MNILSQLEPESKDVQIGNEEWHFPYRVWSLIELPDRIIVHFLSSEFEKNPPEGVYLGCNIWCYDKKSKAVLWIIEEPPIAYNEDGIIWNRDNASNLPVDWPQTGRSECYLGVDGAVIDGETRIFAHTTGCREFLLNPKDGSVKLTRTDLR